MAQNSSLCPPLLGEDHMKKEQALEALKIRKLLPLVTIKDMEDVPFLAKVLPASNLSVIEVAYRSSLASEGIKQLSQVEGLVIGAGTITSLQDAKDAVASGAHFLVTPGLNLEVLQYAVEQDILICPGIVTPTDIITAKNMGITTLKFFPAGNYGGTSTLKALHGPFGDCEFVPTGGIVKSNYKDYLALPYVAAVGGSFVIPESYIKAHDFDGLVAYIKEL